jgi:signal peptidase I
VVVAAVCAAVVVQAFAVEAFHIPSGSMAPALRGHHRTAACPRCTHEVVVGRLAEDRDGTGPPRLYRHVFCPNCGAHPIPLADCLETPGDQILVNRHVYWVRSPSRWEIVVFRLFGTYYIKRLLGLPGEEILLADGDLHVNGKLVRKSFDEARAMRVPVFSQDHAPTNGWRERWESDRPRSAPVLDGRTSPDTLTYRHFLRDTGKCEPIRDEYAYNGGLQAEPECVHDFLIETEITAQGEGTLALRLCDGQDWVEVLLPVGTSRAVEAFAWPIKAPEQIRKLADSRRPVTLRSTPSRVELALVDRRLSLAVDGQVVLSADLPEATSRSGVVRPFQAHADGVTATLAHFRLYRDVHYSQHGTNAVRGKMTRLGVDQYYLCGDNSTNSEDSRYWPEGGGVERASLIGPMLHVRTK